LRQGLHHFSGKVVTNLTKLLTDENRGEDLHSLLTQLRPLFSIIPKAKTAKIVRGIIDSIAKIPGTSDLQIALYKEMVLWTCAEKHTFSRQVARSLEHWIRVLDALSHLRPKTHLRPSPFFILCLMILLVHQMLCV